MRIPLFSHYFVMIYRSTQCCDVYVSGIDESITPEVLLRVCDKFATSNSQIIEFSDGLNSLKAVVRFQTAAIANVFINKCNYLKIDDKCTLKAHKLCYEGSDKIAEKMKAEGRKVIQIDGARVYTNKTDWWLIRSSNTEPAMTARAEAMTPEGLEVCKKELTDALKAEGYDIKFE